MTTVTVPIPEFPKTTMTSREIAELTGKEHAHVMRDIRAMLSELELAEGGYLQNWIHPQNGQNYHEFALNRELTETLLTGYSASARLKVIRRWHELEEQARPAQITIPQSLSEALRLAADLADMKARADAALAIAAPKAEALDRLALADGSFCIRDAAKTLQVKEKILKQTLIEKRWLYRRPMGSGYLAYSDKLQQGLCEHKVTQGDHATKAMDAAITAQQWATQVQPRQAKR